MKNLLILHGTNGSSNENWFPWLRKKLIAKGYKIWVPDLPRADKPNVRRYNDYIFSKWQFDKDSILVGHSSGAVAILGVLQELPENTVIEKSILVAGFVDDLGWEPLNELFLIPFQWDKIKKHSKKFILYHSDNDPYVFLAHGKKLQKFLNAELIVLKGQGHFSLEQGSKYKQFPELLEKILR